MSTYDVHSEVTDLLAAGLTEDQIVGRFGGRIIKVAGEWEAKNRQAESHIAELHARYCTAPKVVSQPIAEAAAQPATQPTSAATPSRSTTS